MQARTLHPMLGVREHSKEEYEDELFGLILVLVPVYLVTLIEQLSFYEPIS